MLNKSNERELAYLVNIDDIKPIAGSDNCEAAYVGGWHIMTRKGTFNVGDIAVYFEIDSRVDTTKPEFAFMERYHGNVKTQKYTFGGKGLMISQGLLMHPTELGLIPEWQGKQEYWAVRDKDKNIHVPFDESRFLTKLLGVTYAVAADNDRKARSVDKFKLMVQRRPQLFKQPWARWMMRHTITKNIMYILFGRKVTKRSSWPNEISRTDEERIQNQPWRFTDPTDQEWIVTEKIDGTSTTFFYRKKKFNKHDFLVCSRNVVFDKPDKKCFYDTNVYTEMAEKYNVETVLEEICKDLGLNWIALQGETFGEGIQKRDYCMKGHDFRGFNLITSKDGRWNSLESRNYLAKYNIPWVPIIESHYRLPATVDEMLAYADDLSMIDGGMREGVVLRSLDGKDSFKAVSNNFLLKYHN